MRKAALAALLGLSLFVAPAMAEAMGGTIETLPFMKKLTLANVGDEEAQLAVGQAYDLGKGIKQSKAEAAKWYRKAADQGNAEAQFRLGRLLHEGAGGLQKDPEAAAKLYQSAAK